MITESILNVLFSVANFVISILPESAVNVLEGSAGLGTILAYALYFFPGDVWLLGLGNGLAFITVGFAYAIFEWVIKKIPGVD